MDRVEFQAARGVLRWAGIGVMPHSDYSQRAFNGVKNSYDKADSAKVLEVLGGICRGVLPQQSACREAANALEEMYDRAEMDDKAEVPHG